MTPEEQTVFKHFYKINKVRTGDELIVSEPTCGVPDKGGTVALHVGQTLIVKFVAGILYCRAVIDGKVCELTIGPDNFYALDIKPPARVTPK